MAEHGYRSPATIGGKIGCVAAALVGGPIFAFLLLAAALGDCVQDERCLTQSMLFVFLFPAVIAVIVGLAVRWLINRLAAKR